MPHTEAPATAPLSKPDLQASGGRIVLPAAEQPIHRLGICVVELRGLGPHIVDRGERANDRGTCGDADNPGHQLRIVTLGRLAEKGSDVAGPGEGRDVGDRIALSAEERHHREPTFQRLENPPDLGAVTVERVVIPFGRKAHEMDVLPEHRADGGHLDHHPLQRVVARGALFGEELPGLVGQVDQDGPGLENRVGLPARGLAVTITGTLAFGLSLKNSGENCASPKTSTGCTA